MEKIKYSIITPNFNSYNLMERYFRSLEEQEYKNFEVIIIDDASTDDSYKSLIQYQDKTKLNMRILRNEKNTGPGIARNYGIKEAKGEWITFIDNDDWVEKTLLQKIDNIIINEKNLDCVIYDYFIDNGNNTTKMLSVYSNENGLLTVKNAIKYTRNHSVCKFYKTKILKDNNIYYPNITRHEDIAFVAYALSYCNNIYHLTEPLYHYVQRANSLSNKRDLDEVTLIEAFNILENRLDNKYKEELAEKSVTDLLYGTCMIMCKAGKSRKEIIQFIDEYEKKYPEWYNSKIITFLGKGKRIFLYAVKYKLVFIMKNISRVHTLIVKK